MQVAGFRAAGDDCAGGRLNLVLLQKGGDILALASAMEHRSWDVTASTVAFPAACSSGKASATARRASRVSFQPIITWRIASVVMPRGTIRTGRPALMTRSPSLTRRFSSRRLAPMSLPVMMRSAARA